jgi:hypothetical protein
MKYIAILLSLFWLFFLWQFISAVVERGLPTNPVYYIFAVIGVIFGFFASRLDRIKDTRRRFAIVTVVVTFSLLIVSIVFYNSGVEILRLIGGGLFFWYIFSLMGFGVYYSFRKWRSNKKFTKAEEDTEYLAKGLIVGPILIVLAIVVSLAIAAAIIYLLVTLL